VLTVEKPVLELGGRVTEGTPKTKAVQRADLPRRRDGKDAPGAPHGPRSRPGCSPGRRGRPRRGAARGPASARTAPTGRDARRCPCPGTPTPNDTMTRRGRPVRTHGGGGRGTGHPAARRHGPGPAAVRDGVLAPLGGVAGLVGCHERVADRNRHSVLGCVTSVSQTRPDGLDTARRPGRLCAPCLRERGPAGFSRTPQTAGTSLRIR
jgi:hypothetical protein